jgi:hypothetical protein
MSGKNVPLGMKGEGKQQMSFAGENYEGKKRERKREEKNKRK